MKAQRSHRFELGHSKHNAEIKVFLCGILISKYFLKVVLTFDLKYLFTTFVVLIVLDVSNFFLEYFLELLRFQMLGSLPNFFRRANIAEPGFWVLPHNIHFTFG